MQQDSFDFLKKLVDTPGPSGYEQPVQRVYRERVSAYTSDVITDVMGNVFATVNPGGSPKIMLAGHADEIGFQVRYISEEGMLYFGSIGGHDAVVTVGQRVTVHTVSDPIPGVLGRTAIHLLDVDDRKKTPKLDDLWIDIGAKDREDALSEAAVQTAQCVEDFAAGDGQLIVKATELCSQIRNAYSVLGGKALVNEINRIVREIVIILQIDLLRMAA